MTPEGRTLREKLRALEREFKEFDRTLRKTVAEFKDSIEDQRKDFGDAVEDRERVFFQQLDNRIEHWRRGHQAVFVLLDSEIEALQKATHTSPPETPE